MEFIIPMNLINLLFMYQNLQIRYMITDGIIIFKSQQIRRDELVMDHKFIWIIYLINILHDTPII